MYNTKPSPAESLRSHSRSPTYADAVKGAPRLAPINTSVARGDSGSNTGKTVSSGPGSIDTGSLGSGLTATTSLTSPSLGSPANINATQSASIGKKPSWEKSLAKSAFSHRVAVATPLSPLHRSPATPQPLPGLGIQVDNAKTKASGGKTYRNFTPNVTALPPGGSGSSTPYQLSQNRITQAKTSPYLDRLTKTDPLSQHPFSPAQQLTGRNISTGVIATPAATEGHNVPIGGEKKAAAAQAAGTTTNTDSRRPSPAVSAFGKRPDSAVENQGTDDNASMYSAITSRDSVGDQTLVLAHSEVIQQEPHPRGFTHHLRFKKMPDLLDGAFDQAYMTLKTVNGDFYELPPKVRPKTHI